MINQFLRAGGARNLQEFYNKFPTEEDFNHYMAYGGGLNRFAPGGPILPGTMSTAIADYQQAQAQPAAGANGLPDYLRRPQNQMDGKLTLEKSKFLSGFFISILNHSIVFVITYGNY